MPGRAGADPSPALNSAHNRSGPGGHGTGMGLATVYAIAYHAVAVNGGAFIQKPFHIRELSTKICEIFRGQNAKSTETP